MHVPTWPLSSGAGGGTRLLSFTYESSELEGGGIQFDWQSQRVFWKSFYIWLNLKQLEGGYHWLLWSARPLECQCSSWLCLLSACVERKSGLKFLQCYWSENFELNSYAPTVGSWWCQSGVMAVSVCHSWRGNGLILCERQRYDCTQLCSRPQVCPGCFNPRTKKCLYMTVFFLSCFIVCLYLNVRYLSMRMFFDLLRVELLSSSPSESCTEMCAVESHYVDCVPTW